ncbi:MAG: hypothetical protein FD168_1002 [Desulfobulbaceae bacterium]|nr:MAG: hypothetical protein FD168_1002 [Desulfobulbaceae bacterium]
MQNEVLYPRTILPARAGIHNILNFQNWVPDKSTRNDGVVIFQVSEFARLQEPQMTALKNFVPDIQRNFRIVGQYTDRKRIDKNSPSTKHF